MDKRIEIFAVGKWNGMTFKLKDLNGIVAAFNTLGDNHKVPLKFGHNKEQRMTDGQPSLGWVKSLSVEGDKLIADVTDIPTIVMTAMDKKLYHNVSVELDFDVTHKGNHYPAVLSGVALLGADIPAVNTLKDLTHYLNRDAAFSVGRQAVFSAIAGNKKQGDADMELDLETLSKTVAKLTTDMTALAATNATLTAANAELTVKVTKFTTDAATADAAQKKAKTDAKRAEVLAVFEEGVKSDLITPAQRGQFTKMLRVEDDVALNAIVVDDVKALVAGGKKHTFGRAQGKQGKSDNDTDTRSPDVIVLEKCQAIVAKKEAPDLFAAQKLLFARDKPLAEAYTKLQEGGE